MPRSEHFVVFWHPDRSKQFGDGGGGENAGDIGCEDGTTTRRSGASISPKKWLDPYALRQGLFPYVIRWTSQAHRHTTLISSGEGKSKAKDPRKLCSIAQLQTNNGREQGRTIFDITWWDLLKKNRVHYTKTVAVAPILPIVRKSYERVVKRSSDPKV